MDYKPDRQNHKGPIHPGQFRHQEQKYHDRTKELCTTWPHDLFDGVILEKDISDLPMVVTMYRNYLEVIFKETGMYDTMLCSDPLHPGWHISLFQKTARFPLTHVKAYIKKELNTCDTYHHSNLFNGGALIRNSLTARLLALVMTQVPVDATGPEMYVATMYAIFEEGFDSMQQLKDIFKKVNICSFAGENVININIRYKEIAARLYCGDAFDSELLVWQSRAYEQITEPRFKLWAYGMTARCHKIHKLMGVCDVEALKETHGLKEPYELHINLCEQADVMYKELSTMDWAGSTVTEEVLSAVKAYIGNQVNKTVQRHANLARTSSTTIPNGGGTGSTDGDSSNKLANVTCHHCGKKGHIQPKCPDLKSTDSGGGRGGGRGGGQGGRGGRGGHSGGPNAGHGAGGHTTLLNYTPPRAQWKLTKSTPTIEHDGNKYYWCALCNEGNGCYVKYHDAKGHHEWATAHNAKFTANVSGDDAAATAQLAAQHGPTSLPIQKGTRFVTKAEVAAEDDFISFGNLGALSCNK